MEKVGLDSQDEQAQGLKTVSSGENPKSAQIEVFQRHTFCCWPGNEAVYSFDDLINKMNL